MTDSNGKRKQLLQATLVVSALVSVLRAFASVDAKTLCKWKSKQNSLSYFLANKPIKMLLISARSLPRAAFKQQMVFTGAVNRSFCEKIDKEQSTTTANVAIEKTDEPQTTKLSGFARAFEKHSVPQKAIDNADDKLPDLPFATLLRNSKLMEVNNNFLTKYELASLINYSFNLSARRSSKQDCCWQNFSHR